MLGAAAVRPLRACHSFGRLRFVPRSLIVSYHLREAIRDHQEHAQRGCTLDEKSRTGSAMWGNRRCPMTRRGTKTALQDGMLLLEAAPEDV